MNFKIHWNYSDKGRDEEVNIVIVIFWPDSNEQK